MWQRYYNLPFPVALGLLSALTIAAIGVSFSTAHAGWVWLVVPLVAGFGGLYLYGYSKRPGPEVRAPAAVSIPPGEREAPGAAAGSGPSLDPVRPPTAPPLDPDPDPGTPPEEDGGFEDPVEEADRLDSAQGGSGEPTPRDPP